MTATLPNALTAARLLAVPILVWLVLLDDGADGRWRWWALGVFLVAAATDYFDGFFARRWHVVSAFGKLADPIADKALVLSSLTALWLVAEVPLWPIMILAVREVAITAGRLAVADKTVLPAGKGGKLKTTLQVSAITFYLVPPPPAWLDTVAWYMLLAAVAVAIISGVRYWSAIMRARRRA